MMFYTRGPRPVYAGSVRAIAPAWTDGPDVLLTTCEYAGVYPQRWYDHAIGDGYVIVCPD